jgi:quercetin dioxygenase-like cupin family protein
VVHIDHRSIPIRAGSSIFLPPGVPHCLENVSEGVLRLLGVFSPPGSPANKMGPAAPKRSALRPEPDGHERAEHGGGR